MDVCDDGLWRLIDEDAYTLGLSPLYVIVPCCRCSIGYEFSFRYGLLCVAWTFGIKDESQEIDVKGCHGTDVVCITHATYFYFQVPVHAFSWFMK